MAIACEQVVAQGALPCEFDSHDSKQRGHESHTRDAFRPSGNVARDLRPPRLPAARETKRNVVQIQSDRRH
eukprot:364091-Chlamydomonas_euryale.AAC.7